MEEGWLRSSVLLVGGMTLLYWVLSLLWSSGHLFRCYVWARLVKGEPWTKRFGQWAEDEYGIETSVVVADFGNGRSIYGHIAKELEGKDIGVLVNNVGVIGHMIPTLFSEWDEKHIWDIVNINVANVPAVTKIILPGMLQRKRGVIINLSSLGSVLPIPMMGMYSGSKAFVDFFSQALSAECEGTGVLIQGVHPGLVHSNMSKPYNDHPEIPNYFFPTADVFVESALATVGHTDYTHGYWGHSLNRVMMLMMKAALPGKIFPRNLLKGYMKEREKQLKAMKKD